MPKSAARFALSELLNGKSVISLPGEAGNIYRSEETRRQIIDQPRQALVTEKLWTRLSGVGGMAERLHRKGKKGVQEMEGVRCSVVLYVAQIFAQLYNWECIKLTQG